MGLFIDFGMGYSVFKAPVVMGILNVTADSFYDGGRYRGELEIINRIEEIVEQGAGIIDIGAYSTRPGAIHVDEDEELSRVIFTVELVRKYYPDFPISVDTFRSKVVREVHGCLGEIIVNDISGGTMDPDMFDTVAELNAPYILTHIQGVPENMQLNPVYTDVVGEVKEFLSERVAALKERGFNRIILDPGFGFGKSISHNYELLNRLEEFKQQDLPLLVGISRKSMIWRLLEITPNEALNGTTVLNTISLLKGADILRVHDVKEAVEAIKIVGAMHGDSI